MIFVEVRSTSYDSFRITQRITSTSRLLRFSREHLAILHAALLEHAERLQDLLGPSWPDAGEIQKEMNHLVDTLMLSGLDQKWFSAYILVEGVEVMLTTTKILEVSLGFLFELFNDVWLTEFLPSPLKGGRKCYH
jgi:hypothetical protein